MIVRWQKNRDYLVIRIYRDLVGDWTVEQSWSNDRGESQQSRTLVDSFQAARAMLLQINRRQRALGYRRTARGEEQLGFDFDC